MAKPVENCAVLRVGSFLPETPTKAGIELIREFASVQFTARKIAL